MDRPNRPPHPSSARPRSTDTEPGAHRRHEARLLRWEHEQLERVDADTIAHRKRARAQLVAWAADVRRREPDAPFDKALRADLEGEPSPVITIGGTLPPAPYVLADTPDLSDRIDAVLLRRPDLERPDGPQRAMAPPRPEDRFGLELGR